MTVKFLFCPFMCIIGIGYAYHPVDKSLMIMFLSWSVEFSPND